MTAPRPGERKQQILHTLASMLGQPVGEKITTAALAARLEVSEAALYRHFASKAQMFEGLIDLIETTIFDLVNPIVDQQQNGLRQVQEIADMLLEFAEHNPGMTRVIIGDALVNEDPRLQHRMNQFLDRVELSIRQAMQLAVSQHEAREDEITLRANMVTNLVLGRWNRFAKTGFKEKPCENAQAQIRLMMA